MAGPLRKGGRILLHLVSHHGSSSDPEWFPPSQKHCHTCLPWFWHLFWHSFWYSIWHSIWPIYAYLLTVFLAFYLAHLLTFFLADILTFYLPFYLPLVVQEVAAAMEERDMWHVINRHLKKWNIGHLIVLMGIIQPLELSTETIKELMNLSCTLTQPIRIRIRTGICGFDMVLRIRSQRVHGGTPINKNKEAFKPISNAPFLLFGSLQPQFLGGSNTLAPDFFNSHVHWWTLHFRWRFMFHFQTNFNQQNRLRPWQPTSRYPWNAPLHRCCWDSILAALEGLRRSMVRRNRRPRGVWLASCGHSYVMCAKMNEHDQQKPPSMGIT